MVHNVNWGSESHGFKETSGFTWEIKPDENLEGNV